VARVRTSFALVCALVLLLPGQAAAQRAGISWPQPKSGEVVPGQVVGNVSYAQFDGPRIRITTFGQQTAWQAGIAGMVFEVARADGGTSPVTVPLELDYSGFRNAFGGEYPTRLNVVRMPECAAVCGPPRPVAWRNDIAAGKITAEVPAEPGGARFALTSMPGDFADSSSSSSSSSQGEQPGYVGRSYRRCAEDMAGGSNSVETGDECWETRGSKLVQRPYIEMPGLAADLVMDETNGTWRAEGADDWQVVLLRGARNGDDDGEHWQVTSPQGTRFVFGANRLPGANSAWTVPVFGNHPGEPCWAEPFDAAWCQQAYRWNLEYIVDSRGVAMSYFYDVEVNHYGRTNNESNATPYVRAGNLARIEYLQREQDGYLQREQSGGLTEPGAWIVFTTGNRCAADTPCSTTRPQDWPEVPWDQACSAAPCTDRHTPVFFSSKRLAEITVAVRGGRSLTFPL
jgi:hypothetical protein